jgi:mannose-1-phosphate guanylyltransferase
MTGEPDLEAVILAGGLGTRLGGVLGDLPKTMAPVGGRPFLGRLLDQLVADGIGRVLLCLGHRAGPALDWLAAAPLPAVAIVESRPLGTGGALRLALPRLGGHRPVLVMNGDSWIDAPLAPFLAAHRRAGTVGSLLCVEVEDGARYGRIERDAIGRVLRFREKDGSPGRALISAGRYLLEQPVLDRIAGDAHPSLESGLLQALPPSALHAHAVVGSFFDIGTPASLAACDAHFRALDQVTAQ